MLATLLSQVSVAFSTLFLAVALTTVPTLLAMGGASLAVAGVLAGRALTVPPAR